MGWLIRHLGLYLATNGLLVALWALLHDSEYTLGDIRRDPTLSVDAGFWPMWVILGWGFIVAIHAVFALTPSRRRRRQRRDLARATIAALTGARSDGSGPTNADGAAARSAGAARTATSGAVTVVFTDLAESTALTETLGDEAYAAMLREHRAMVRSVVADRGGQEINTVGDGFLLAFDSAFAAVATSCAIAHELRAQRSAGKFVPGLRIGIHTGDVIDQGDDLVGAVLNVAARICGAAAVDEILVSEAVAEKVMGRVGLLDRGLVTLKGVGQARHLFAVDWDDSAIDRGDGLAPEPVSPSDGEADPG